MSQGLKFLRSLLFCHTEAAFPEQSRVQATQKDGWVYRAANTSQVLSALEWSFVSFPTEDKDERRIWLLAQVCYIQSDDMQLGGRIRRKKRKMKKQQLHKAAQVGLSPRIWGSE